MKSLAFCLLILGCGVGEGDFRTDTPTDPGGGEIRLPSSPVCTLELAHRGFVTEWQVDSNEEIRLPLPEGFNYEFAIDWGDDTVSGSGYPYVSSFDDPDARHTYASAGTYTVSIHGMVEAWSFAAIPASKDKIIAVKELGDVGWKSLSGAFAECSNLETIKGGEVSQVTDMSGMFTGATSVRPDMSNWNFAAVRTMAGMFTGVTLPEDIYSQMLNRIVQTTSQKGVIFDGGNSRYNTAASVSRSKLVSAGWQIEDGGELALR